MVSLLGGGSTGEGGNPLSTIDYLSVRKMWAASGLLSSGRVGSTDDEIRSTTWVSFNKGRMGSKGGKGSIDWISLSNGRVGLTKDGIRSTTWVTLSNKRVGLTKDGIRLTTLVDSLTCNTPYFG
jgi:hypothetical protein